MGSNSDALRIDHSNASRTQMDFFSLFRKRKKIIILAAMKDVPIMQGMEECVLGTVLRERGRRHAVKRDVPIR